MTNSKRAASTQTSPAPGKLVRLSVNLNQETADALKEIAADSGVSLTEAVRRAISVYKFVDDEREAGRRVQTVDPKGGAVRELVLV